MHMSHLNLDILCRIVLHCIRSLCELEDKIFNLSHDDVQIFWLLKAQLLMFITAEEVIPFWLLLMELELHMT